MSVELSLATQRRIEELFAHIADEEKAVISFDIFDTLICRPTLSPTDIFALVEAIARVKLNKPSLKFYKMRVAAERMARQDKEGSEVTFNEIYAKLVDTFQVTPENAQALQELEMQTELNLIQPRPIGRKLFDEARRLNKKIVLVSDMYLPDEFIEKLLKKCNFQGHQKLYVSASCGATKHHGHLYNHVLVDQNIVAGEIVHFGDNLKSDIKNAQALGVLAFHVPRAAEIFWRSKKNRELWKPRIKKTELGMRLSLGLVVNQVSDAKVFDEPDEIKDNSHFGGDPYVLGFYAAGPWLLTLTKWIMDEAIKDGFNDIYFVSRDGKLPHQVFDKLKPFFPAELRGHYLYASRSMIYPLEINGVEDIIFNSTIIPIDKSCTIRDLLTRRLCLRVDEDVESYLREKGYSSLDESPDDLETFLLDCADLSEKILKSASTKQEQLLQYYSETIQDIENSVIFDIGFNARLQRLLSNRLKQPINAYYLMSWTAAAPTYFSSSISKNFLFPPSDMKRTNTRINALFPELLISDIHTGSCLDVTQNDDGTFKLQFEDEKLDTSIFSTINFAQTGALDFVTQYIRVFGEYFEHLDILPSTSIHVLEDYSRFPSSLDAKILECVTVANDIVGHTIHLVDPSLSRSHWKSGAQALDNDREKALFGQAPSFVKSPQNVARATVVKALSKHFPPALHAIRKWKRSLVHSATSLSQIKTRALLKLKGYR